ncbi:MAG: type II secretion system protein [Chthoniobacteraceae bacterium]
MNIKKFKIAFTLIELLVVISIIAILAGIALPVFTSVQTKGNQAKDMSNAKQIGLGLRLYASDNSGYFPTSAQYANSAFTQIVPTYIPTQKIFYLANSGWSTGNHPVEFSSSGTLAQGQNNFAYVSGLLDSSNTNYPLLADGFTAGVGPTGPGNYNSIQGTQGGVWKGTKAIVVRVDDSATIETTTQSGVNYQVMANGANTDNPSTGTPTKDIFTVGTTWMPGCVLCNPQ